MVAGMVRARPCLQSGPPPGPRQTRASVTVEVSRAALTAGATNVFLLAEPHHPTSNALYQRVGYVHVTDSTGYEFSHDAPEAG
jgi:hypothetical protein